MLLLTPVENAPPATPGETSWRWAQSADGLTVSRQGQATAAALPPDPECVLVLPPGRLSWQRVKLPKVAPARLRATLDGLLEERLLDEPAQLHWALEPGAKPGQAGPCWVAVCHKAWLNAQLQALEQAGRPVGRIIPAASPQATDSLHLQTEGEQTWCIAAGPEGVLALALLAPAHPGSDRPAQTIPQAARLWLMARQLDHANLSASADAASLALAEASWPALEWTLATAPERWLQPLRQGWNLAQFDLKLSARQRRGLWLPRAWRTLARDPAWRPVRWSLAALLAVQLLGLNALAWREQHALRTLQSEMRALLQQTFPQVKLVLDAPRQMQAELERLRQRQGELGAGDLESLLQALGASGLRVDFQRIEFHPGSARLSGLHLPAEEQERLRSTLLAQGWRAELAGSDWRLSRENP